MISVILPFYNAKHSLKDCIKSLLNQTHDDFELILCNDGSNDNSAQIAKSFLSNSRVKLISQENQGVALAHNFALKQAQGDFIARMDSDDWAHPDRLKLQYQHLSQNPEIAISATCAEFQSTLSKAEGFSHFVDWNNKLLSPDEILANRFVEMPLINPTTMIRRAVIDQIASYRKCDFPEDYDYWLKAMEHGLKISKLKEKLLTWNDSDKRLSRANALYHPDNFYRCKAYYLAKELKQLGISSVCIWGAGNNSRTRAQMLLEHDITINSYIDVSPKLIGREIDGCPVLNFEDIHSYSGKFILSYVGNRGVRDKIKAHLEKAGFEHFKNFILCA